MHAWSKLLTGAGLITSNGSGVKSASKLWAESSLVQSTHLNCPFAVHE